MTCDRSALGAALIFLLFLFCLRPAAAAEMVVVSDLHFNPMAKSALVDRLAQAPVEQWQALFAADDSRASGYGTDPNWKLLASALAAMKAEGKPALVLMPGDFLAHQFRAHFNTSASDHSDAAFRAFTLKTLRFLARELRATFPETPMLPVLGNNDSFCGDYALRPGGRFLAASAAIMAGLIGRGADAAFARSWRALGNYVVPNPAVADGLIVALNTNFLARDYRDACGGDGDGNPARATLAWLSEVLHRAQADHRQVWLLYHIPPGADAFATARHGACPVTPVPMFASAYAQRFHALMARYRDTIAASFAGHIHMDSFELLADAAHPFGFVLIDPAISPIFGQNPGFRRLRLARDGALEDGTVHYLANLGAAAEGAAPQWRAETNFDAAWQETAINVASLEALYHKIGASPAARERWFEDYAVQSAHARAAVTAGNAAIYRCALGHDRVDAVARCACPLAAP
jgi:sphingomyelin phosphodiesterase acid-like 3